MGVYSYVPHITKTVNAHVFSACRHEAGDLDTPSNRQEDLDLSLIGRPAGDQIYIQPHGVASSNMIDLTDVGILVVLWVRERHHPQPPQL